MEAQDTPNNKDYTMYYTDGRQQHAFNKTIKEKLVLAFRLLNDLVSRSNEHTREIHALTEALETTRERVIALEKELEVQRKRTSRFRNRLFDLEDK